MYTVSNEIHWPDLQHINKIQVLNNRALCWETHTHIIINSVLSLISFECLRMHARVCVLWAGRQCGTLISRVEPISCLACSLNVAGDFLSIREPVGHGLVCITWFWSFLYLLTSTATNLISCHSLFSFSPLSRSVFVTAFIVLSPFQQEHPWDYGFCIFSTFLSLLL